MFLFFKHWQKLVFHDICHHYYLLSPILVNNAILLNRGLNYFRAQFISRNTSVWSWLYYGSRLKWTLSLELFMFFPCCIFFIYYVIHLKKPWIVCQLLESVNFFFLSKIIIESIIFWMLNSMQVFVYNMLF